MMQNSWKDDSPIYKQLQDQVCRLILDGSYPEQTALPSVRQVSSEMSINHLTVAKAYQGLVDQELLIMKRGVGMFVETGAQARLQTREKNKFFEQELPAFINRLIQLDIEPVDIINKMNELIKDKK